MDNVGSSQIIAQYYQLIRLGFEVSLFQKLVNIVDEAKNLYGFDYTGQWSQVKRVASQNHMVIGDIVHYYLCLSNICYKNIWANPRK